MIKSKEGKEHGVVPPGMLESIENILSAHGFETSSLIPESMLGKRFRGILELVEKAEEKKRDGSSKRSPREVPTDGKPVVDRDGRSDDDIPASKSHHHLAVVGGDEGGQEQQSGDGGNSSDGERETGQKDR